MPHKAFISYSHQSDAVLAPAIRSALHSFARPWYRMRALSIFLDSASLSANAALGPSIEKALGGAEWFLLLASPVSAKSRWVRQEAAWWLENRSIDRTLILLTDGELVWDAQARDFDWTRTTALCDEFAGRFADEPLYVDLRWARTQEQALNRRGAKFRSAILDIAAPLHGRPKDELDGDDVRQHRRRRFVGAAAVTAIVAGAVFAGWQAYLANLARDEAETQRKIAEVEREIAVDARKVADDQRILAEARKIEADQQRDEASRQRDEARKQRDAALGALLRAEADRLESLEELDTAVLLALESARFSQTAAVYETVYRIVANRAKPVYYAPEPVAFSVVSSDGRQAAAINTGAVTLIDLGNAREPVTLGESDVRRARFNPDGTLLALVNGRGVLKVFDVPRGTLRSTLTEPIETHSSYQLPNLSEDGSLAAVSTDRTVRIFSTFDGRVVFEQTHSDRVSGAFPVGPSAAAVVTSSGLGVLSANGFVALKAPRRSALRHIAVGAAAGLLAFKFHDPAEDVVVWNPATGEELAGVGPRVKSAAFKPQGDRIALGLEDGTVTIRSLSPIRDVMRFKFNYYVSALKFSADGRWLIALSSDTAGFATVHRIDTAGWLQRGSARVVPATGLIASNSEIVLDARGATVAAGRSVLAFDEGMPRGWNIPPQGLDRLAVSSTWNRIAGVVEKRAVSIADANSGVTVASVEGCDEFGAPALNADGSVLAVRCHVGQELRLYDIPQGRLLAALPDTRRTPLTFTPAGDAVASGNEVIDIARRKPTDIVSPGAYATLAFSRDGRRALIAAGGFGSPALYESIRSPEGKPRRRQIETGMADAVAYSADGVLAAAGFRGDPHVRVYRRSDWKPVLLHHKEEAARIPGVVSLVFSHDGRLMASVAESQRDQSFRKYVTLRVFDIETRTERLRVPLSQVPLAVRFTPDNRTVQVLGGQPRLEELAFPLDVRHWTPSACGRVRGNLTPEQWRAYLPSVDYRRTCEVLNPAAIGPLTQ